MEHLKKPTLEGFLVSSPPGTEADVQVWAYEYSTGFSGGLRVNLSQIELHCSSDSCKGLRFFSPRREALYVKEGKGEYHFLDYTCKNCEKSTKVYAIFFGLVDRRNAKIFKIGETPAFGPPTPTRLLRILEKEREYYLKGRRSENQGMGIGAFAYYRRVVENQKSQIFDEIIKVAQSTGAPEDFIDSLRAAKSENSFTRAVDSLKAGFPQVLLIDGHNPLTLLHSALSEGLHAKTDNDCLELAHSIRIVLTELAERLGEILKDQSELKAAVSKLMTKKSDDQATT